MFASITKPAAAVWRARAYFFFGLTLLLIHALYPEPFPGTTNEILILINKAFGSLDKAGYFCLIAGAAYAVISDVAEYLLSGKLADEFKSGLSSFGHALATGVRGLTFEGIMDWIQARKAEPGQLKLVGQSALKHHYEDRGPRESSYIDFVIEKIMDKAAGAQGVTRENYQQRVTVRKRDNNGLFNNGLFEWEEEKSYSLVCSGGEVDYPLQTFVSFRVDGPDLPHTLNQFEYFIKRDGEEVFNFSKWWDQANLACLQTCSPVTDDRDGLLTCLSYDGKWLRLECNSSIRVKRPATKVEVWEKSYLHESDRCFGLLVEESTYRLSFTIALENMPGWRLKMPILSAQVYSRGGQSNASVTQLTGQRVSATVDGWALPGIGLLVEWTPPEPQNDAHDTVGI